MHDCALPFHFNRESFKLESFVIFVIFFSSFFRFVSSLDSELTDGTHEPRHRREVEKVFVAPPHLCVQEIVDDKPVIKKCHAYTTDLDSVKVQASLKGATNQENKTHSAEWCNYPLGKI